MKGLDIRKSDKGYSVIRLHYTADPDKDPERDGADWYAKTRAGTSETAWAQEYEMDPYAKAGKLVYPEFDRSLHLVEPFRVPDSWTRYFALDYALHVEAAALWVAVSPDGDHVYYREHYVRDKLIPWHANRFHELEGYQRNNLGDWEEVKGKTEIIRLRLSDPDFKKRNPVTGEDIDYNFRIRGIACLPANNKLIDGIEAVREGLTPSLVSGKPRIYLFDTLRYTISEIEGYRYPELTDMQSQTRDPSEKPVKKKDHLVDCLRYLELYGIDYQDKDFVFKQKSYEELL